jgi:PAS domain-containing protein
MTANDSSTEPGLRRAAAWSAVSIALAVTFIVAGLGLLVHLVLVNFEQPGSSLLGYDLGADLMLAMIGGLVVYDVLRREALAKRRAVESMQRAEEARREQARIQAIEAERSRLIQIMDAIPHGVCIIAEDHDIDYVNPVMERTFGRPSGRKCYEYLNGLSEPPRVGGGEDGADLRTGG